MAYTQERNMARLMKHMGRFAALGFALALALAWLLPWSPARATAMPPLDLIVSLTDGVTMATPGGSVTYTFIVSNAGPNSTASGFAYLNLPPEIVSASWTGIGMGGGTCSPAGAGSITDPISLPPGGGVLYTLTAIVSPAATGSLSVSASAVSANMETNSDNNLATDIDTLIPQADLAVTMTDGVTTATPGESVTYTLVASNMGPSDAPGATVNYTLPAALTATWTGVGSGGATCGAAGSGNISDAVSLPAGGSVTYTISATLSAAATGTLSNTATVASGSVADPISGNNSATDTDTLAPQADLAVTLTDGVTSAAPGGTVTYTLTASNAGPSDAPGATVVWITPIAVTSASWTGVGAVGATCTAAGSGNIGDTVNLPAGGSVTYTIACTVNPSAIGSLSATATVSAPAGVTDPTPGNNSATDTDILGPEADLSVTITNGAHFITPGGSVTYTLTVANSGPSGASGVLVNFLPPPSLTDIAWTGVGAGGATCTASGSGSLVDVVSLPKDGSVTYTITAHEDPSFTGGVPVMANLMTPPYVTDPNTANNSAHDVDTLLTPDLSATPLPDAGWVNTSPSVVMGTVNLGGTPDSLSCAITDSSATPVGWFGYTGPVALIMDGEFYVHFKLVQGSLTLQRAFGPYKIDTAAPTATGGALGISTSEITLSGTADDATSGVSAWQWQFSTTSGGPYADVPGGNTQNCTHTGLLSGTTYYYRLCVTDGAGNTGYAAEVSAATNPGADATLAGLSLSSGTLTPAFSGSVTEYTATVGADVDSVTVTATATDTNATIGTSGGDKSVKGTKGVYGPFALAVGENEISVLVTAQDGETQKTYTVTVTRKEAETPDTGDRGPWAWAGLMLLAGASLMIVRRRKRGKAAA